MPDHSTIGAAPQLQIATLIPKVASFCHKPQKVKLPRKNTLALIRLKHSKLFKQVLDMESLFWRDNRKSLHNA